MNSISICAASLVLLIFTGCASERNRLVLAPVGPMRASAPQNSDDGALTVYSAFDTGAHFYSRNDDGREYSDYSIFDKTGRRLRRIHNSTDTIIEAPATVSLPSGKYIVRARANGYGNVTVPVAIEAHRQTILHLEGGGTATELAGADPDKTVRLPDGQVVGFRSEL